MSKRRWSKVLWWTVAVGLAGLVLTVALRPTVIEVTRTSVSRGPMAVTIDEEGETRIRHRFVVSAPVTGRLERIELEPGDTVTAGRTVVARVRAESPPLKYDELENKYHFIRYVEATEGVSILRLPQSASYLLK